MPAQWLNNSSEFSGRLGAGLTRSLQTLSQPANLRLLRRGVVFLLALWTVLSLARVVWGFVPGQELGEAPPKAINPIVAEAAGGPSAQVDIEKMRAWHLFGKAGAAAPVEKVEPVEVASSEREGIEDGARETRLKVVLRGIVASSEDGLGHAVIEHNRKQAVYAVEDKLPVSGKVTVAKVMPRQVVLNNRGTYELLKLFDDSPLGTQKSKKRPARKVAAKPKVKVPTTPADIDKRNDVETTKLAQGFRDTLYSNPQSLAKLVRVGAVRKNGSLLGYRVSPGQQAEQFAQLGFESGDMVTAVNGIKLDNPANTMQLYNAMRSAGEVVFELERDSQPVTISVNLSSVQ
ncbi:MAG: type II secretion system protein GspC [Halioglobus sp.]